MSPELNSAIEHVEARAWEQMCRAVPTEIAATLKLWVGRYGSATATRCLVADSSISNRVIGLGCDGADPSDVELDQWVTDYRATGHQNFVFQLNPQAEARLGKRFEQRGLGPRSPHMKLYRDAKALPPSSGAIEVRKLDAADKALFGETSIQGFERPPIIAHWMASTVGHAGWHHYLAFVDDQPAGAAAVYIEGNYAWLGIGSTRPDFRQCGVQQALIAQRIDDGIAAGVEHFTAETESRNISCANLVKHGFVVAYERANYGLPEQ